MTAPGYFPMGDGNRSDSRVHGAPHPGRVTKSGHSRCRPCEGEDTRLGPGHSRQDYVRDRMRSRGRGAPGAHGSQHRDVMPGPEHWRRHHWLWSPKSKRWMHLEPAGTREISPGKVMKFLGKLVPPGALPRGWPKMQITPPNFLLHHGAPGLVPVSSAHLGHAVHAPSAHVPGHYGWSPVLHKHVWIGAHTKGPTVAPSQLPPAARAAFAHAAKQSKERATRYAHAHTYWGASGARTSIIPGHWQWNKTKHEWCYIEPHTDTSGRPSTMTYPVSQAPPAAFGPRPRYLPALHFWPDAQGMMRDAHLAQPVGASVSVMVPPHARYAIANGLMDPPVVGSVLGSLGQGTANAYAQALVAQNNALGPAMTHVLGRQQTSAQRAYLARHHLAIT